MNWLLNLLSLAFYSYFKSIKRMFDSIKLLFCRHNWKYRDVILKCDEHDGINNTVFSDYYRKCDNCSKCQKSDKTVGNWVNWINIDVMDFSKYPVNIPIEKEVHLFGEPSKKSKKLDIRKSKIEQILKESDIS